MIEVLAGEVEVTHNGSDASRRIFRNQQTFASESKLIATLLPDAETERSSNDRDAAIEQGCQRVTTAIGNGDDSTIIRGTVLDSHKRKGLIQIKNPFPGEEEYCSEGYITFDLNSIEREPASAARFVLALQPSGLGFTVRVPDCKFSVDGLIDESLDNWSSETLNWDNAPASLEGLTELDTGRVCLLGQFEVARGVQYGKVSIEGPELVEFLNSDTNRRVTLIVVRETPKTRANGLVHGFASRLNANAALQHFSFKSNWTKRCFSTTAAPPTI